MRQRATAILILALAYGAAASVSHLWYAWRGVAALAWPSAGVALFALVRFGPRLWPGILIGALGAAALFGQAQPPLYLAVTAVARTLAILLAALLYRRLAGGAPRESVRAVVALLLAAVAAALLGGTVAVAAIAAVGRVGAGGLGIVWSSWLFGDLVGALAVAPLLFYWWPDPARERLRRGEAVHLTLCLLVTAAVSLAALTRTVPFLLPYHALLPLIWAALAHRLRGASAAVAILTLAALIVQAAGLNAFTQFGMALPAKLLAQQFVIVAGVTTLLLAALTDERRAAALLRATRARLDQALNAAGMIAWEVDRRTRRISYAGDGSAFFGRPVATAADFYALVHPDDRDIVRAATRDGVDATGGYDIEYRMLRPDGSLRWFHDQAQTSAAAPDVLSGINTDITTRKADEERQRLLMAELDHRVKNILATIQALIARTAQSKGSVEELAATLEGRVQAMARAHSLFAKNRWESASLRTLIAEEVRPYGGDRVAMTGPEVALLPRAGLSLSLAFHELCTNAAKYGALSTPAGHVDIGWRSEDGRLIVDWRESGGPPIREAPTRKGFGGAMTERVIRHEFGGEVTVDYRPEGVAARLSLPIAKIARAVTADAPAAPPPPPVEPAGPVRLDGRRILVAEDSPLVADAIEAQLAAAGATVAGPFAHPADAEAAARDTPDLDAALLDVNLSGGDAFGAAAALAARDIPFLFATGYGDETVLPPEFRDRPRLPKPYGETALLAAVAALLPSVHQSSQNAVIPANAGTQP